MARRLNYALIGCGNCGVRKHLASYALLRDEVNLYGVYDYDPELAKVAAKEYGVQHIFNSYEELLAEKLIDLVSVVTINSLHAPIAIAALKAGKHVHVDKPMAMNAVEAQAMLAAKNAAGKKLMVGLNNRFTETSQFAKRYIEEGHLGEIYHARCGWCRRRGLPAGHGSWFGRKEMSGGGPVIDLGVHYFDLTLYLMGFPTPTSVSASTYSKFGDTTLDPDTGKPLFTVEDFAAGFAKFDTGASVAFEFSWASNIEQETTYLELLGSKGGLRMNDGELKIFTEMGGEQIDILPRVNNCTGWGENETKYFIECIKTHQDPLASAEDAVKMMQIIDAIYASSASGREIEIARVA